MSSVVIAGDTSGSITIAAPAVAGSNTLTLPAATGTVIYSNASDNLLFNSGYGSLAVAYGCRAWVNFNGTGTVVIRGSGNVTSITDNGVGDYTVNFTNAMPDANYSSIVTANNGSPSGAGNFVYVGLGYTATTSSYRFNSGSNGVAYIDCASINVSVFR